jgi:hypothetical protein
MPRTLPSCAITVDGVYFVPVEAQLAKGKKALRYQCLHPYCTRPLQARHLSRHVRGQHVQSYNAFRQNGDVVAVPENWEDRLLGPIWGGASTEFELHHAHTHGIRGAAAPTQDTAGPPPQLPAEPPSQEIQEQLYSTLTAGHGAELTAQPAGNPEVCVLVLKDP